MRIILADHNLSTLWALRKLLEEEPELEIVYEATDLHQLLTAAERGKVDLVLLDRSLPGGNIKAVIADLQALAQRPIVVVMISKQEDGRLMLREGADAVVSKTDHPDWLLETVHRYTTRQN